MKEVIFTSIKFVILGLTTCVGLQIFEGRD